MQRPLADEYDENYQKYFDLVLEGAYLELLTQNSKDTVGFFETLPKEKLDHKYAPGKWTIKELLMHLIDTERVFLIEHLLLPGAIPRNRITAWTKNCMRIMLMFPTEHCRV